jgi:hypothetical protein
VKLVGPSDETQTRRPVLPFFTVALFLFPHGAPLLFVSVETGNHEMKNACYKICGETSFASEKVTRVISRERTGKPDFGK